MIVDDDSIIRTSIQCMLNWESYGCTIAATAHNGRQALQRMASTPVDILIVDINMPVMGGLELVTETLKAPSPPQILILSAYNDYALVREAFKLGVQDYLLKSEITPESLLEMIRSMTNRLPDVPEEASPGTSVENRLRDFLKGSGEAPVLPAGWRALACLEVEGFREISLRFGGGIHQAFTSPMRSIAANVIPEAAGCFVDLRPDLYALLMWAENRQAAVALCRQSAGEICSAWKRYLNTQATAYVCGPASAESDLYALYETAREHLSLKYVLGLYGVIPEDPAFSIQRAKERSLQYGDLIDRLASPEWEDDGCARLMQQLAALPDKAHLEEVVTILYAVNRQLDSVGSSMEAIMGKSANLYRKVAELHTRENREIWLQNYLSWIADYLRKHLTRREENQMEKARRFILENYTDGNLSLRSVAGYAELSEKYFSKRFTQDTGETFSDYVTRLRMEKAKQLFQKGNNRVYEVCYAVGYNSAENFSRAFKRYAGISPSAYLSKLNK